MSSQNGGRIIFLNRTVQGMVYGVRLVFSRSDGISKRNIKYSRYGQSNGVCGDLLQGIKTDLIIRIYLLVPVLFVQIYDFYGLGIIKISHVGIVKCQVGVFTNAENHNISGILL